MAEGSFHLQGEDSRQAASISGLKPMCFGAQKLALLPVVLAVLSLDISRQG